VAFSVPAQASHPEKPQSELFLLLFTLKQFGKPGRNEPNDEEPGNERRI
jgi:hypothetical protein